MSVASSRRYRDFEDYLLPAPAFAAMRTEGLPLAVEIDAEKYLAQRTALLHAEFLRVDRLAQAKELPDASVIDGVLKITSLDNQESDEADKWEHINLTGDYHWRKGAGLRNRKLRPLRTGVIP